LEITEGDRRVASWFRSRFQDHPRRCAGRPHRCPPPGAHRATAARSVARVQQKVWRRIVPSKIWIKVPILYRK
jgi:hypothetical protein